MKIFDTGGYLTLDCLANAIKNLRFARLISESKYLSKYVMYVT